MSTEKRGVMGVLIGGTLWGTIGVFVLYMNQMGSTSLLTCFLRMAFAFLILLVMTVYQFGWSAFRIDKKSFLACVLLGLICQGIYNIFYNEAILDLGMTLSAVLLNLAPLCGMIASRILFHETFTLQKLIAMLICIAGCCLTITGGHMDIQALPMTGILFGIGSGLTYGMTSVFGRMAGFRCNAWVMSTYSYLFAALFLIFFTYPLPPEAYHVDLLGMGFLYALIPTALGYLFYYQGVQKITENSKVPVIASIETVISALFGVFLFHENLGPIHILGIVLVMASIVLMNYKKPLGVRSEE